MALLSNKSLLVQFKLSKCVVSLVFVAQLTWSVKSWQLLVLLIRCLSWWHTSTPCMSKLAKIVSTHTHSLVLLDQSDDSFESLVLVSELLDQCLDVFDKSDHIQSQSVSCILILQSTVLSKSVEF